MKAKKKHNGSIRAKKSYKKGGIFPPKIQQMKNNLEPVIYDGMLDEVVVTPYTSSEYAFGETMGNKATGGLKPVYPIFDVMTLGLKQPFTAGVKGLKRNLTSEKTLGKAVKSQFVPKFIKPSLLKKYKSKFPNVDLRGAGTGNYTNLGVKELGLKADDFKRLTDYERSAISQVNQVQAADDVFNTFVQRYGDFNIDDDLANKLADYSRRNPRTKFEINLGLEDVIDDFTGLPDKRPISPSKRMQEIFDDPTLNVNNVWSSESKNPMEFITKSGFKDRLFYDSSGRDIAGEFEKNLRSYGQRGFYAANVPTGKPVRKLLTRPTKSGSMIDYTEEILPVADFVVNKGLMRNPDNIGNLSLFRGGGDMANQHNFLLGITDYPSVILSGNKGFAGLKGGNKVREKLSKIKYPIPNKSVPSYNQKMTPILKQEFEVLKPFDGTFIKMPSVQRTYYNKAGKASPSTSPPDEFGGIVFPDITWSRR